MLKTARRIFALYFFAYKYTYRVNCCFAMPALGIYGYFLFKYRDSALNEIFARYMASASSHKLYINGVLSDNVLVDGDKLDENFAFYLVILLILISLCILFLYVLTLIAFMRDLSSRHFIIKRTGKLIDDLGFAITFCSLAALFNIFFAININGFIYTLIASFIQCAVFLFLLKNQAYGYSIKKRSRKIIT